MKLVAAGSDSRADDTHAVVAVVVVATNAITCVLGNGIGGMEKRVLARAIDVSQRRRTGVCVCVKWGGEVLLLLCMNMMYEVETSNTHTRAY